MKTITIRTSLNCRLSIVIPSLKMDRSSGMLGLWYTSELTNMKLWILYRNIKTILFDRLYFVKRRKLPISSLPSILDCFDFRKHIFSVDKSNIIPVIRMLLKLAIRFFLKTVVVIFLFFYWVNIAYSYYFSMDVNQVGWIIWNGNTECDEAGNKKAQKSKKETRNCKWISDASY